jgi:hypothetical protein
VAPQVEVVGREECQPTIMDAYVTVGHLGSAIACLARLIVTPEGLQAHKHGWLQHCLRWGH